MTPQAPAATELTPPTASSLARAASPITGPVLLTFCAAIFFLVIRHWIAGADYVGLDNDDTMRLVQVRDLLNGQDWFDLTQYRLGLEGGTPMHWSRLIDLPIANLISLFSLALGPLAAEAAALAIWPLLTTLPLFYGMALAARNIGGQSAVAVALVLAALFVVTGNRFAPGAIDHHNVQMALLTLAVAGLLDRTLDRRFFAVSGVAAGLSIVIGAETIPVVSGICLSVALVWLVRGEAAANAAKAFGLALAATLTTVFYLTVPPGRYEQVACDALSTGFYTLGTIGGGLMFLTAALASRASLKGRIGALAVTGALIAAATVIIAPECLQSPLAELDPALKELWLASVTEAQSIAGVWRSMTDGLPAFYAVPAIALAVALWQAAAGRRVQANLVLAGLLTITLAVALVQVRGAAFANLLAIPVLAAMVGDLRTAARARPQDMRLAAAFFVIALGSAQATWALLGTGAATGWNAVAGSEGNAVAAMQESGPAAECRSVEQMRRVAAEPTGVVSAVSNIGDDILRHTDHRVLSAPYHRNQGGMLTQLHTAMATPDDAEAFLRGAGVSLVLYCETDPETTMAARRAPDGLYAVLGAGTVPDYLEPVHVEGNDPLRIYRVLPESLPAGR